MPARVTATDAAPPDLATVYESEVDFVWESLRRLGVREADLEDVTHDVFLAVQRRLPDYDPARPLRPWIFGFAYRVASDYRRSGRVRREVGAPVAEVADQGPTIEDRLAAAEARRVVLTALDTLTLEARAVFVLHDLEGYSVPDIAAALDEPANTLYSRLRLARARFAAAARDLQSRRGEP